MSSWKRKQTFYWSKTDFFFSFGPMKSLFSFSTGQTEKNSWKTRLVVWWFDDMNKIIEFWLSTRLEIFDGSCCLLDYLSLHDYFMWNSQMQQTNLESRNLGIVNLFSSTNLLFFYLFIYSLRIFYLRIKKIILQKKKLRFVEFSLTCSSNRAQSWSKFCEK